VCCSIDDTAALLTNVEVRCILEQNRSGVGRARGERIDPRAEYIQNQVHLRPLNAENSECLLSPAAQVVEYIDSSQCKQTTAESIARFIDAVKTFGLTQAEMLQLVNHQPAQEVEIHTVGNSTQCRRRLDCASACVADGGALRRTLSRRAGPSARIPATGRRTDSAASDLCRL